MPLTIAHLTEFLSSAITPEMAELNFWSIQDPEEGFEIILGDYSGTKGAWEWQGKHSKGTATMFKIYENLNEKGWVFQGANGFCCIKPNKPRVESRGRGEVRVIKYESPYHVQHSLFMPSYTPDLWQQILGDAYDSELSQEELWAVAGTLDRECFLTEGAKKAVAIACQGFLALGLPGKDNWRTSYRGTKRDIDPVTNCPIPRPNELVLDVLNQFHITYAFDQDEKPSTRKSVTLSLMALAEHLDHPPLQITWKPEEGKGVDDILYSGNKTMDNLLESKAAFKGKARVEDSERTSEVVQAMRGKYLHDGQGGWWEYNPLRGTWRRVPEQVVKQFVGLTLQDRYGKYSCHQRNAAYTLASCDPAIFVENMGTPPGVIGFTNGVLDLNHEGGKFRPATASDRLIDRLPYPYNPEMGCPKILEWLEFVSGGDPVFIATLRAFYNCILFQRFSYQKFLELVGVGGSGKGTALRLGRLLVGRDYSQELYPAHLNDRFELAALRGKKLATISDAPPTFGDMTIFRALTGEDSLRAERKGIDREFCPDFVYEGMVMIAAHQPFGVDGSSGMMRRRISLLFDKKPTGGERRQLISVLNSENGWDVQGEFAEELPGFFNWVSLMPEAQVRHLIANDGWKESSLMRFEAQKIERSGMPLLDWMYDCCCVDPNTSATWGKKGDESEDAKTRLYPNYVRWCEESGTNPMKLANFKRMLAQAVQEEFGLTLQESRSSAQRGIVKGISIRHWYRESIYGIPTVGRGVRVHQDGMVWEGKVCDIPNSPVDLWKIWTPTAYRMVAHVDDFTWIEWA